MKIKYYCAISRCVVLHIYNAHIYWVWKYIPKYEPGKNIYNCINDNRMYVNLKPSPQTPKYKLNLLDRIFGFNFKARSE